MDVNEAQILDSHTEIELNGVSELGKNLIQSGK